MNRLCSNINIFNCVKSHLKHALVLIGLITPSFAMDSSSICIAVLEDPTHIEGTPFASRAKIFGPLSLESDHQSEKDQDFADHGVAVCSVLVGKDSLLPKDTSITLVPSIDLFSSYLKQRNPKDLVILNWSGSTGYPGLSEEVLEGLTNIEQHFAEILGMGENQFAEEVHEYINAYEEILDQLQGHDGPLTSVVKYAKECLLTTPKQAPTEEEKKTWINRISEKIEIFKQHGEERAKAQFQKMKKNLLECLMQHENTLIVWALGNDGKIIDTDPFWQDLLSNECILSHAILIHGTRYGRVAKGSNFTSTYLEHSLGKPFQTKVWDREESKYIQDEGTSFSTPLATMDAFNEAKKMSDQTGQIPTYAEVKARLLKK